MGLLKDIYSRPFYDRLSGSLQACLPGFDTRKFLDRIYVPAFGGMELKARMKHTSQTLREFVPANHSDTAGLLIKIINRLREEQFGEDSLEFMFLPEYIAEFGIDDYDNSVRALEFTTQFVSCEFAVRPFLIKYGNAMIRQMTAWSKHPSHKVRRLSSEGSRPRLPWAMGVPSLKTNPQLILPILENLKEDPSDSVRRSVANSLNDIAKDHPDIVLKIVKAWKGISKETDAIIRHGSRTLLKQGNTKILSHYGLSAANIEAKQFKVAVAKVKIGGSLEFSFTIANLNARKRPIRLEYAIYYNKKNGLLSKKVFKISERVYEPGEKVRIIRRHSFKLITTRVFYAGRHELSLLINGAEKGKISFELTR